MDIQELKKRGFVVSLQRKDFILYTGLIVLAHEKGLVSIETEPVMMDFEQCRFIFKATVIGLQGERFTSPGS